MTEAMRTKSYPMPSQKSGVPLPDSAIARTRAPAAGDGDAGFHAPGKIARSRFATLTLERLESPCSQRDVPISTRRSSP